MHRAAGGCRDPGKFVLAMAFEADGMRRCDVSPSSSPPSPRSRLVVIRKTFGWSPRCFVPRGHQSQSLRHAVFLILKCSQKKACGQAVRSRQPALYRFATAKVPRGADGMSRLGLAKPRSNEFRYLEHRSIIYR